ncbi:MAG: hypothetical protein Q8L87_06870 [Anaerolineales bacterium]|nr:hypothetical protein [Anaerolineales bacterium]
MGKKRRIKSLNPRTLDVTEKLLFGFTELRVRDDGVIPAWQNAMRFEIDKRLLFIGNMVASFILSTLRERVIGGLYNAHGHIMPVGYKLRFPSSEKAQFVTALGIPPDLRYTCS